MSEHYTDGLNEWVNTFFIRELTTADDVANYEVLHIRLEYRAKKVRILTTTNTDVRQDTPVPVERMDLKTVAAVYAVSRQEAKWSGNGLWTTVTQLLEDRCVEELDRQYRTWLYKRGELPEV